MLTMVTLIYLPVIPLSFMAGKIIFFEEVDVIMSVSPLVKVFYHMAVILNYNNCCNFAHTFWQGGRSRRAKIPLFYFLDSHIYHVFDYIYSIV